MSAVPHPNVDPEAPLCALYCEPSGRVCRIAEGSTLMDAIGSALLPLAHACGGVGACGFCRVTILDGAENLSSPGDAESEVLRTIHARSDERLACFARVHGDVRLTTSYW